LRRPPRIDRRRTNRQLAALARNAPPPLPSTQSCANSPPDPHPSTEMAAGDSRCQRGSLVLEAWQLRRHSDSLEYTRVGHQHHKDPRRNATRATNSRSTTHLGIGDAWMDDASRASPRGAGGLDVRARLPSSGCFHHLGAESRISSQFLIAPGPATRTQLSMSVHPADSVACADRVERLPSRRCFAL